MRVKEEKKLEVGECARKRKDRTHFIHVFHRYIATRIFAALQEYPPKNPKYHLGHTRCTQPCRALHPSGAMAVTDT